MSLADDQRLLTRLLTDPSLLKSFLEDPEDAADRAGFPKDSARRLAQIPPGQLRGSGVSLIHKRAGAVAKILSQTRQALGLEAFQGLFRRHAESFWPNGAKRHRADAIAFAEFLQGQDIAPWIVDLAALETLGFRFRESSGWLFCCKLCHHPEALVAATADRKTPPRRPTILVGIRLGRDRRIRWLALAWPFGSTS